MGVYIKGMEMPRYCDECKLLYDCASCMVLEKAIDWETSHERRRDDCPLVEVKEPHGRLIDAEQAREAMMYEMCGTGYQYIAMSVLSSDFYTPTVLEAEVDT